MNLKTFDVEPNSTRKSKSLRVRVTIMGVISLNTNLSERLGLVPGMGVDFHQDKEEAKDWYISVNPKSANKVRHTTPGKSFLFNNARLAESIRESVCPDSISYSVGFPVSSIPIQVEGKSGDIFAIITSVAIKRDEA